MQFSKKFTIIEVYTTVEDGLNPDFFSSLLL